MSILFEPIEINGLRLKNRFVRAATFDASADEQGKVTDTNIRIYSELARGGVGLIITGFAYVHSNGQTFPKQLAINTDEVIPGLKRLVDKVHEYDAKIALQIVHCGRNTLAVRERGETPVAPSLVENDPFFQESHRALTVPEIENIIDCFGQATRRAKEAGFDAVELHAAHSYLFAQFLSPRSNRRPDQWGGNLDNRMRFHARVVHRIREIIGDDYPLLIKLGLQDTFEGGLTLEEGCQVAQKLATIGIDAIEVSEGLQKTRGEHIRKDLQLRVQEAYYKPWAKELKKTVSIPVILSGGMRSFDIIERIVKEDYADCVSMSRPFIREPAIVRRWQSDDRKPSKCISCKLCYETIRRYEMVQCLVAPCTEACPCHVNVPRYIRYIRKGKFDEALAVNRERLPLPSVCSHACFNPCEDVCAFRQFGDPIAIRALKRMAVERGGDLWKRNKTVASKTGKRVAIVGAGPAGLSAAYYLASLGHEVTMYDSFPEAGGIMRYGIPKYRLPVERLEPDIREILALGVHFQPNTTIGKDIPLQKLREDYNAVFLAIGANESRKISIEGLDKSGVDWGLDFLRRVSQGEKIALNGDVIVVGGGNVAVDVALTAKRLGAENVSLVCLEKRDEMPAHEWEISLAEEEGVELFNSWGPKTITGNKTAAGIEFIGCTSVFDKSGNFSPTYDEKVKTVLEAPNIILAIGQASELGFLQDDVTKLKLQGEFIKVAEDTLSTNVEGIFAGGDVVSGPASIIDAIAQGRKAASSVDKYLGGQGDISEDLATPEEEVSIRPLPDTVREVERRAQMPLLDLKERLISFEQIERGLNEEQALDEAKRCLSCDARLYEVTVYAENCKECGYCMEVCGLGIFTPSGGFNKKGYRPVECLDSQRCIGCLNCFFACPDYAININEVVH